MASSILSAPVPEAINWSYVLGFLAGEGIHSVVGLLNDGTSYLRILRNADMLRMGKKMKLLVKGRQVMAAVDYLEGRITGTAFLRIMDEEYADGRRKYKTPDWAHGRFPLTRFEGKKQAQQAAGKAGNEANKKKMQLRLLTAYLLLPTTFTAMDLMRNLGVQKPAALELGYHLVEKGLAAMRRIQGKGRARVEFTRTEIDLDHCERLMFGVS